MDPFYSRIPGTEVGCGGLLGASLCFPNGDDDVNPCGIRQWKECHPGRYPDGA